MDDLLFVCGRKSLRDLNPDLRDLPNRHRVRARRLIQPLAERLAFEQLHDDVGDAVGGAHVVHGQDVRMESAAMALASRSNRARAASSIASCGRQHFDGNVTVEAGIPGPIDLAHSPCTSWATTSYAPRRAPGDNVIGGDYRDVN